MSGYIVALRYTAAAGGYAGVITWTRFKSKEGFDAWFNDGGNKDHEVVEEGITEGRAIALCDTTPLRSLITAAFEASTDKSTGQINPKILVDQMRQAGFVIGHRFSKFANG